MDIFLPDNHNIRCLARESGFSNRIIYSSYMGIYYPGFHFFEGSAATHPQAGRCFMAETNNLSRTAHLGGHRQSAGNGNLFASQGVSNDQYSGHIVHSALLIHLFLQVALGIQVEINDSPHVFLERIHSLEGGNNLLSTLRTSISPKNTGAG